MEYKGLGDQFEEMGKTFQGINSLPHIVIGKDKPRQNKVNYIKCPYCNNTIQLTSKEPPHIPRKEDFIDNTQNYSKKILQWSFIACICLVIGYALYRLLWG